MVVGLAVKLDRGPGGIDLGTWARILATTPIIHWGPQGSAAAATDGARKER